MFSKFKFSHIAAIFVIIVFFNNCNTNKSSENNDSIKTDSGIVENETSKSIKDPNDFKQLILTNESGGLRFGNIGKNMNEVIASEKLELSDDSASNYKSYSQYFHNSDDEFVDIQYFNNGKFVTGLNFDVYLNEDKAVKKLMDDFLQEFNTKYGKATEKDSKYSWQLKNNNILTLKDVGVKLAPGLQIRYANKNESFNTTL